MEKEPIQLPKLPDGSIDFDSVNKEQARFIIGEAITLCGGLGGNDEEIPMLQSLEKSVETEDRPLAEIAREAYAIPRRKNAYH